MIFSERRFAVVLSVFMLSVFFLCAFEYKFITAAAVISIALTVALIALRFIFVKANKNKLKNICELLTLVFIPLVIAVFFCILHFNISEKPVLNLLEKYKDTPVYIKAEITNASSSTFYSTFDLKVYEINGEKTKKFNLSVIAFGEYGADEENTGDILEIYVTFKEPDNSYKSHGYYIAADSADVLIDDDDNEDSLPLKISPAKSHSLTYYLQTMRTYTRKTLFKNIKYDYHDKTTQEAAVVYGIFTGDKSNISPAVKTDFKKSGISHVLAVSGLHLSILCGIMFAFLNLLKVHKKITCLVIILCCLFFMAFTGFSMSVTRSGIMLILFYSAFLIGRKSDSMTSLLIAGTVITLLNPYNILNLGFQLSFTATLGIITTTNLNNKILSKLGKAKKFKNPAGAKPLPYRFLIYISKIIISSFIVTISAVVFTLPFISYNFKTLSLISPVTNLLTAPLVTAVLFLALCIMLFSFIPVILGVFSFPAYFITKLLLGVTNYLGRFKYAYISVESTNGTGFYVFAVILLVLIILCFLIPKISAKKLLKSIVYSLTILAFLFMSGSLIYPRIIFKDSVRFAYYSDDKNQNIILFQKDYDSVDIIDITHGTQSHIKPVYDIILENGAIHINSVILSDYRKRHVQMLKKYMVYSEIKKVYIPEPLDDYDIEVLNMLYFLSVSADFELIKYTNSLRLDDILITVKNFDHNKMRHIAIELDCKTENSRRKLLYLGIGYKDGYEKYTDINDKIYDIVFYGSHKHNRRDDDYISNIYGTYAGVISNYLDENKNITSQKLDADALNAYLGKPILFKSEDYGSVVFEIQKNGELKYYLK